MSKIICSKCNCEWNTKSLMIYVSCPCCLQKVKNNIAINEEYHKLIEEIKVLKDIPCNSFDFLKEENICKCFHYTNLQPLWSVENTAKSDKIIENTNKLLK